MHGSGVLLTLVGVILASVSASSPPELNGTSSTWTASKGAASGSWNGLASDNSGKKLIAASAVKGDGFSGIYLSSDGARTWKNIFINGMGSDEAWTAVASNSDGYSLYALQVSLGIYASTNGGQSWSRAVIDSSLYSPYYNSVSCSSSGAVVAVSISYGYLYVSNNFAYTFNKVTASGTQSWMFVSVSPSGSSISAGSHDLYTSSNSGYSFQKNPSVPAQNWWTVAYSQGSAHAVAVAAGDVHSDFAYGGIYLSSDSGATWTQSAGADRSLSWKSASIDVTGQYITAVVSNVGIYYSIDFGKTFTKSTTAPMKDWFAITGDLNGYENVAVARGSAGGVYYSTASVSAEKK